MIKTRTKEVLAIIIAIIVFIFLPYEVGKYVNLLNDQVFLNDIFWCWCFGFAQIVMTIALLYGFWNFFKALVQMILWGLNKVIKTKEEKTAIDKIREVANYNIEK